MIMRKLTKNLLDKSIESFFLSLELFNKPTVGYRTESFSLLFTNSWELLMKARIYEESKGKKLSIFRRKKPKQRRESITIDECLNKIFSDENDPIKRNIQYISEIRNEATHLVVQELDPYFSRAFQAGVINYINYLQNWFGINLNQRLKPGLFSLITDVGKIPDLQALKNKYSKEDFKAILRWVEEFGELEKLGIQAALSIKHTVAIVRNPKKADFIISAGLGGKALAVIDRIRDVDISHPYNRKAAIEEIRKRIPRSAKFSEYNFEAYVFVKKYKKSNNEYFWKTKYSGAGQYSQKFIDELVQAIAQNPRVLGNWKKQYSKYLKQRKSE